MSLLPSFMVARDYEPWDMMRPTKRPWEHFGMGVTPPEIQLLSALPLHLPGCRQKDICSSMKKCGASFPHVGKDGFQVSMDIEHFLPSDITVKTIDNTIVVEGKHDEKPDEHGHISRQFIRKYNLPEDYDPKDVHITLSSDGFLTIKAAPPSKEQLAGRERILQIQHTGPAHLHIKHNGNVGAEKEKIEYAVDGKIIKNG